MRNAVAVMAVMVASCAGPAATPVTAPADRSSSTTTSVPAVVFLPATYAEVPCSITPPVTFAVLCESFEDIDEFHVDGPDPAALAAAAALGVGSAALGTDGSGQVTDFSCVTPHESFGVVCDAIARRAMDGPIDMGVMVTAAVRGMFRYGLDPFSSYVPGAEMEADFEPSGLVVELGMVVSARDEAGAACGPIGGSCAFEVLSAFEFGPASSAGLAVGDRIVAIDGWPTEGLSAAEATVLLGGAPGTGTVVAIDRDGTIVERSLTREDIRTAPSEIDFLDDGIVYMRLNDFSQQAAVDLGFFLQLPEVEAASGMVLDLRDNPGGLVLAAQGVASQFLDGGVVMVERGKSYVEEIPVIDGGLATDRLRLVVLVNRASASAAEIVAAVLQERGRAVVVGETTFGKNLVQSYQTARDGGMIGITIARWETPEGLDIGIRGLEPDVVVTADADTEADEVLDAGLAVLSG
ncbi:MAG: S41 family peptidase [Acidimicrobiia bacterium]